MRILFRELMNFRIKLLILIAAVCGNSFCVSRIPVMFSRIIDGAAVRKDAALMTEPLVIMVVLVVCALLFGILMARLASAVSLGVGRNLRKSVFEKVQDFSADEIDDFSVSSLIVRTNSDITVIQFFMTAAMGMVLGAPVTFVISVITAFQLSAALAVIMLPMIGLVLLLVFVIGKKADRLSAEMQTALDRINLLFRERLTGVKVIRAFGRDGLETEKFSEVNLTYTVLSKHQSRLTQSLMPAFFGILGVTIALMLWITFVNVTGGSLITTGELVAVIQLMITILLQVAFLAVVMMMMPRAAASSSRTFRIPSSSAPSSSAAAVPVCVCPPPPLAASYRVKSSGAPASRGA